MPRRYGRARIATNRRRRRDGKYRLHKPKWIDPFPWIPGTRPEKMVFAMLVEMRVYFIFQGQVPEYDIGGEYYSLRPINYIPDFVLPEHRIIIDPFGEFHHSLPQAVERDRKKIAAYAALGYAYYHPWSVADNVWRWNQIVYDIYGTDRYKIKRGLGSAVDNGLQGTRNTREMLSDIPELAAGPRYELKYQVDIEAKKSPGYRLGPNLGAGANSVAAANRLRAKPHNVTIGAAREF